MRVLTKWDHLQNSMTFSSRLTSLFAKGALQKRDDDSWITKAQWAPLVDISEDDHEYLIQAEIPGVEKDQVKVTVENGMLLITGERSSELEEKNRKHHRMERPYGSFIRSFALPDDADGIQIKAEAKDGVLKLHLPKHEIAKPRSIEIKVN